jgi:hypothetical protein
MALFRWYHKEDGNAPSIADDFETLDGGLARLLGPSHQHCQ